MLKRLAPLTLLVIAGCTTLVPKTSSVSKLAASNAVVATAPAAVPQAALTSVTSKAAKPTTAPIREATGPFSDPGETDAMSEIAPMLQEIAAADPGLHAEVLHQLGGTKPSLWSLTVQRAQQTLAYRQQLAGTQPNLPTTPPASRITALPPPEKTSVASSEVIQASASVAAPPMEMVVVNNASAPPSLISNVHYTAEDRALRNAAQQLAASAPINASPTSPIRLASRNAAAPAFSDPPSTPLDLSWQEQLDAAIFARAAETGGTARSPEDARERIRLQLMQLAAGRTDDAVASVPGLSTSEQGYWSNQLYALSTMLETERSTDRRVRADATAHHQAEASAKLRELGSLQIRHFTTCREVYGFGAYDPITDPRYSPGDSIILYAEIDNYQSDSTAEGYRTAIRSSYHLVSADGTEAASGDFPEVDDLCLTRRRDFHIQYTVPLPRGLRGGDYRLELTVTDALGNKTGHDELRMTVDAR